MVVMVFRSRLRGDAGSCYPDTAERMLALVRQQPGFLSFKTFQAKDGERVSLAEFESAEAVPAWGAHPEHRQAQAQGRAAFYERYDLQICDVLWESHFPAAEAGEADGAGGASGGVDAGGG